MQFPKISKKAVSLLLLSAMFCSSFAFAQGLTPGQVANDDRSNIERAREEERKARLDIQREQERAQRQAREERDRRAQLQWEADQAARRLQDQIDQQNANFAAQQAELAREAARIEADRQVLMRQGSASIIVKKITRKTNGEWIRVTLATPMQLSKINIAVLEAAVQIHQVTAQTENQQSINISDLNGTGKFTAGDSRQGDLTNYADRIVALDIRAEAMGALATLNITVNSVEGTPRLSTQKFSVSVK